MARKKQSFPKSLLNQINEFSTGGFMLFNINAQGELEVHSQFDNNLAAVAMQHYIEVWTKAMEVTEVERSANLLSGNNPDQLE